MQQNHRYYLYNSMHSSFFSKLQISNWLLTACLFLCVMLVAAPISTTTPLKVAGFTLQVQSAQA